MAGTRTPISTSQVDAKSPIDEALTLTSIKCNDDDHETRILALEAAGVGGGPTLNQDDPTKGVLIVGGQDNVSRFERRRFWIYQQVKGGKRDSINAYDSDKDDLETRLVAPFEIDTSSISVVDANTYSGILLSLAKNESRTFRCKKGENYFGLMHVSSSALSNSITITVDDVAVNSATLGIVDEDGVAVSATFSSNTASTFATDRQYFFGLDPNKEQAIRVECTDSASKLFNWSGVETGFYTPSG